MRPNSDGQRFTCDLAWSAARGDNDARAAYLDEFSDRLVNAFDTEPIDFPGLDAYDTTLRLKPAS